MKQILLSVFFYSLIHFGAQAQTTYLEYDDLPIEVASNTTKTSTSKELAESLLPADAKKLEIKASKRYVDLHGDRNVQFSVNSNYAKDFVWKFGDGSIVSGFQNTSHTYKDVGTYQVQVVASNEKDIWRENIEVVVVDSKAGLNLEEMGTYVVFPNDNLLELDIQLRMPKKEKNLLVDIADIEGSGIYKVDLGKVKRNQRVKVNFETLEPGKYYITLRGKRFSSISKLIVAK